MPGEVPGGKAGTAFPFRWPFPEGRPGWAYRLKSRFVIGCVGTFAKVGLGRLNRLHVHGPQHQLMEALDAGRPVLTFTNHISNVDDPYLWAQLGWERIWDGVNRGFRWAPCAADVCFTTAVHRWGFAMGRCVPFLRDGSGVYQRGVDFCIERLNGGDWVHIYPQGRCNMGQERMRLKWGIGRMLAETKREVLLLPFYHMGMEAVMPMTEPYYPRVGKDVTVVWGEPVSYWGLAEELRARGASAREKRQALTDLCQEHLYQLWPKAEQLHKALPKP